MREDLVAVLKPFMIAQRVLEGQDYASIGLVPFVIHKIHHGIMADANDIDSSIVITEITH